MSRWYMRHRKNNSYKELSLLEAITFYRDLIQKKVVKPDGAAAQRLVQLTHKLASYTAYQAKPLEERIELENPLKN